MKNLLLILFSLAVCSFSFAQNGNVIYKSKDIIISVNDVNCKDVYVSGEIGRKFLKIENLTKKKIKVSYSIEIQYASGCDGCDGSSEYYSELELEPKSFVQADCNYQGAARMDVLVSHPKMLDLGFKSFELKNIKTVILN